MTLALSFIAGLAGGAIIGFLWRFAQGCPTCEELIDALDETVAVIEQETRLVRPALRECLCAAKETLARVAP